jgi:hypothetical protein
MIKEEVAEEDISNNGALETLPKRFAAELEAGWIWVWSGKIWFGHLVPRQGSTGLGPALRRERRLRVRSWRKYCQWLCAGVPLKTH